MIKFDDSFNWLAILKDLMAGMPIDESDKEKLRRLAHDWPMCACGQLCKNLPRRFERAPADDELYELGVNFYGYIKMGEWSYAAHVFRLIEARTTKLLDEQNNAR